MKIKVDTSKLLKQVEAFGRVQKRLQSIAENLGAMGGKNDWDDIYDGIAENIKYDVNVYSADIIQFASVSGAYLSFITDSCKQYDECDAQINPEYMIVMKQGKTITIKREEPMTLEEMDIGRVNPHYYKKKPSIFDPGGEVDYPYSINCQRCVLVLEARMRGFNVSAKANIIDDNNDGYVDETEETWRDIFGKEHKTGRIISEDEKNDMLRIKEHNSEAYNLGDWRGYIGGKLGKIVITESDVFVGWLDQSWNPINEVVAISTASSVGLINSLVHYKNESIDYNCYEVKAGGKKASIKDLANAIDQNIGNGERHQIAFSRGNGISGHTLNLHKKEDGRLVIIDSQVAKIIYANNRTENVQIIEKYLQEQACSLEEDSMAVRTLRIDNKEFNEDVSSEIFEVY